MTHAAFSFESEEIQEQELALTRLARGLIGDEHKAQDVVQSALALAWERYREASRAPANMRAWLRRVVHNAALRTFRDEARRNARETAAAVPEEVSPERVDEHDLRQIVARGVASLPERYRTVLVLRYYRNLAPKVIAGELGIPVSTVDTRILRARERLRHYVDRELGDDCRPLLALLLLPRRRAGAAGSAAWASWATWGAALAAASVACALVLPPWDAPQDGAPGAVLPVAAGEPSPCASPSDAPCARAEGSARDEVARAPAPSRPPELAGPLTRGRVLDVAGRPVPYVRVTAHVRADGVVTEATRTVVTDERGGFGFPDLPGDASVAIAEDGWATVMRAEVSPAFGDLPTTVLAAPCGPLRAFVRDQHGEPVEGARLLLRLPRSLEQRHDASLQHSLEQPHAWFSDADGRVAADAVPSVPEATLLVQRSGYTTSEVALAPLVAPFPPSRPHEIRLWELSSSPTALSGRVADSVGRGVAGAYVSCGPLTARTDAAGSFYLDGVQLAAELSDPRWPRTLTALRPGFLPVSHPVAVDGATGRVEWPANLELILGEPAHHVRGTVRDAEGAPIPGTTLMLEETTLFGRLKPTDVLVSGNEVDALNKVVTGDDGSFELAGIPAGEHVLLACSPDNVIARIGFVAGQTRELTVRIDRESVWEELRGRVVDEHGAPLGGTEIRIWTPGTRVHGPGVDRRTASSLASTRADAEGRFVLERVPREHVQLQAKHPAALLTTFALSDPRVVTALGDRVGELQLRLPTPVHLQLTLARPDQADSFQVLDGDGAPLVPRSRRGPLTLTGPRLLELLDGRSRNLIVDRAVSQIVLLADDEVVARHPVFLTPGVRNDLTL